MSGCPWCQLRLLYPILDALHLPRLALRLLWLLALAVGVPAILWWLASRRSPRATTLTTTWHMLGAMLLVSIAGTTTLAASWATANTLAQLLGRTYTLDATYALAGWLLGRGLRSTSAYALIYMGLLLLCVGVGTAYDSYILPRLAPQGTTRLRQALGLALLSMVLVIVIFTPMLILNRQSPLASWWQNGGSTLLVALMLGLLSYAITTVYGRRVALTIIASASLDTATTDGGVPAPPREHTQSVRL